MEYKKTRKQEDKKTEDGIQEDKKTRKQEDKTIDLQAKTVSSRTNVSYSRIPVFLSSKTFCILVFSSSNTTQDNFY
jgi:hypothetical protein